MIKGALSSILRKGPLTWDFFVAELGFEPRTSGL